MEKKLFLVTLNWKGEIHKFYTWAKLPETALRYSFIRLAKKLEVTQGSVGAYFDGSKDNISVIEKG